METTTSTAPSPRKRKPRTPRRISVAGVQRLSPRVRRITFEGQELAGFVWSGPAAHLKLIFPEPGQTNVPPYDPDGPRRTTTRTYTPRRFDPQTQRLEVDFVLHGDGPGSTWAMQAQRGQELVLLGPARGYEVDETAAWYVFAVDETALPALETLLEVLPASVKVTAFIEMLTADEERPLPGAPGNDIRWVVRDDSGPGSALFAELEKFAWPAGAGRVYVGCEAIAMRRLRGTIVERSGLDKERIVTRGYWRVGAVNHPDHDYAND